MVGAAKGMGQALPYIVTVVLLLGLLGELLRPAQMESLFTGRENFDILFGTALGSVSTGNAVTSYVLGGELLNQGIRLEAVTAFMVAWVTVGVVQLPAEAELLGRHFALVRNGTSAVFAVLVGVLTVRLLGFLP